MGCAAMRPLVSAARVPRILVLVQILMGLLEVVVVLAVAMTVTLVMLRVLMVVAMRMLLAMMRVVLRIGVMLVRMFPLPLLVQRLGMGRPTRGMRVRTHARSGLRIPAPPNGRVMRGYPRLNPSGEPDPAWTTRQNG
jgi:hypothetical protein